MEEKREKTKNLLNFYEKGTEKEKEAYIEKLAESIEYSNYSKDFVSISEKTGAPIYNCLIDIADQRAWEVSQKDYQDTLSVTKAVKNIKNLNVISEKYVDEDELIISTFLTNYFYKTNVFKEKMKMYCEFREMFNNNPVVIDALEHRIKDSRFHQYYKFYGTKGCSSRSYEEKELKQGWEDSTKENQILIRIYSRFKENDRVLMPDVKLFFKELYNSLSISKSPKATDLADYFELSKTNITTPDGIKKGFKLGKRLK